jgi:hypothetical protein
LRTVKVPWGPLLMAMTRPSKAFLDLHLYANLVAGNELGEVGALELICQTLHNWMN